MLEDILELETQDYFGTVGDTINLKFNLLDTKGNKIVNLVTNSWSCKFTLRDPISGEAMIYKSYNDENVFTADYTTDSILLTAHPYDNEDVVLLRSSGVLPAGLLADTPYYVINASANAFALSLTPGGSAVSFSDNGTGIQYVTLASYLQKEHDDSATGGKGVYYNGDAQQPVGLNITEDQQLVVVLGYKDSGILLAAAHNFDVELFIDQAKKAKITFHGNLILEREVTKSV